MWNHDGYETFGRYNNVLLQKQLKIPGFPGAEVPALNEDIVALCQQVVAWITKTPPFWCR